MKIKADAFSKNTGYVHNVLDRELDKNFKSIEGGTVRIDIVTKEIALSGQFWFRMELSADEIARLYQASLTADLTAEIRNLRDEVRELRKKSAT